ncbi:MAG: PA14 domain-containing protein [Thermoplasmata archaeon]|nr:PA14 domain-containing protein [Thermoplasmata archaeon]
MFGDPRLGLPTTQYCADFTGYLNIPVSGNYTFGSTPDDYGGMQMMVDGAWIWISPWHCGWSPPGNYAPTTGYYEAGIYPLFGKFTENDAQVGAQLTFYWKAQELLGQDANCTVSFYLDSISDENLIYSETNVFVPYGENINIGTQWIANESGEHQIIVIASDVVPSDIDLTNNEAAVTIFVEDPQPGELAVDKVRLSGIQEGYTLTYYEWELLITVTNYGSSAVTDVQVKDVLPAELELLEMVPSTGNAISGDQAFADTRATPLPPVTQPIKSTHIAWTVGVLEPGQSETLYLKVFTRVNPGGNQEFTSPGTYIINEGACAKGIDSLTGDELEVHSQAITVVIEELAPKITLPALKFAHRNQLKKSMLLNRDWLLIGISAWHI